MGTDATRTCALPGSNFDKVDAHWEDGEVIDGDMVREKRKTGFENHACLDLSSWRVSGETGWMVESQ